MQSSVSVTVPIERDEGKSVRQVRVKPDQLFPGARALAGFSEHVLALPVKLAGRRVERQGDVLAGRVTCRLDGRHHQLEGFGVALQIRRKAARIAHRRG